jgi:hypothetical protein
LPGFGGDSGNGFVGMIAVNKESFAILLIPGNETVDVAKGTADSQSGSFLIPIGIDKLFNDVVFFIFCHGQENLSDNNHLIVFG